MWLGYHLLQNEELQRCLEPLSRAHQCGMKEKATGLRKGSSRKRCLQKTFGEDREPSGLLIIQRRFGGGGLCVSNTAKYCLLDAGFVCFKYC